MDNPKSTVGLIESYSRWRSSRLGQITNSLEQQLLCELLGSVAGKTLLDVGCGDGAFAVELARRGAAVTGLDADPKIAERGYCIALRRRNVCSMPNVQNNSIHRSREILRNVAGEIRHAQATINSVCSKVRSSCQLMVIATSPGACPSLDSRTSGTIASGASPRHRGRVSRS